MSCRQHHAMLVPQDLSRTLEAAGGCELTFNAITALTAARVLNRIAEAEGVPLEASTAQAIAGACGGDLLNAIETLQLYSCGKVDPALLRRKKVGGHNLSQPASPLCYLTLQKFHLCSGPVMGHQKQCPQRISPPRLMLMCPAAC